MKTFPIIPQPAFVEIHKGRFSLTTETAVSVSEAFRSAAEFLVERLRAVSGLPLSLQQAEEPQQDTRVRLIQLPDRSSSSPEGYELDITSKGIELRAGSLQAMFHACQTLLQLAPVECEDLDGELERSLEFPQLLIRDFPRFSWRGMHLDVGRHFMPKEFIKTYIDLLASYKLNVFHWHLTEDQGWRIEIKAYPKLTEIGAWRMEQGQRYGGFYSQDDVREVVEYAEKRGVTIVPEIEMPGHALAALAAYPELSCSGGPFDVPASWGIFDDVFCAGNEQSFLFLETVLEEVLNVFPGPFIHIGGDECPKTRWKSCSSCQERMRVEGLQDEDELQSYFIRRIEKFLKTHDRKLVGWDEILEGGLAPGATVMSWRGVAGGIQAAELGQDVVMTPQAHCYFDYYQSEDRKDEPQAFDAYLPLEAVYAFEPIPSELSTEQARHVLGGQGNLWTEYIPDTAQAEYMLLPRLCALAEALWSQQDQKNAEGFLQRLSAHYPRFEALGLNYRRPEGVRALMR